MTREEIQRVVELGEKATKGPWIACLGSGIYECTAIHSDADEGTGRIIADFLPDYEMRRDKGKVIINDLKLVEEYRTAAPDMAAMLLAIHEACDNYEDRGLFKFQLDQILGRED